MRFWKQVLVLVLLAVWLPMANHCYLELAGILPSDECLPKTAQSASADPCDAGCKLIEKAAYKVEAQQKVHIAVSLLASILTVSLEQPAIPSSAEILQWPPETLHLPQFVMSTALPARAPSFLS